MPNWKKVVLSGSNANLASLTVDGTVSASYIGNGSGLTSVSASRLDGTFMLTPSASITQEVSGIKSRLRSNEAQVFGDWVFINSTGSAQIGNSTSVNTSTCIAMCVTTSRAGTQTEYLFTGIARNDSWNWTTGSFIYLSATGSSGNTATQVNFTGSNYVTQILAIPLAPNIIYVNPQLVQVITA